MQQVIFDYDGVLVDTFHFHLEKVNQIYDISLTAEEYKRVHDGNFFDNRLDKFDGIDFRKYAETVSSEQSRLPLNDGAKELLTRIKLEHELHMITSGWKAQVESSLRVNSILNLFTTCQYADNGKSKHDKLSKLLERPEKTSNKSIFITDTLGDLLEANQLDLPTIAVTFGFHEEERLLKGSPTYLAHSFKDVGCILEEQWRLQT